MARLTSLGSVLLLCIIFLPGTFQTSGPVCSDGNLRLQNSSFSSSGVVVGLIEVCVNGSYGGICDIGWDDRDATVACNLLGFRGRLQDNFILKICKNVLATAIINFYEN